MANFIAIPGAISGGGALPAVFGTGSDGDLYIAAGETVTLDVPVPHQSVVEVNCKSVYIEPGGVLTTSDCNAGLVLRCQGDCYIGGTIDQSCKAGIPNPDSTYVYPDEVLGGDGGNGGSVVAINNGAIVARANGGNGLSGSEIGGGHSGGGAGGAIVQTTNAGYYNANIGTAGADAITTFGAGGNGYHYNTQGLGGTTPGANGASVNDCGGGGGGAGNIGGGVIMLYVGGNLLLEGTITCAGGKGGNGGTSIPPDGDGYNNYSSISGAGGGGSGGGSIYIVHYGTQTVTGTLNVDGGAAGAAAGNGQEAPTAGGIGTVTIKQYAA